MSNTNKNFPLERKFTLLSEIEPKRAQALWSPRIYLGEITIIDGDPCTNKSSMVLDLAARLSAGAEMPDGGKAVKGGVVLLIGEDSISKTVIPRLKAAGADLSRIVTLPSSLTLPDKLQDVKEAAQHVKARLVVIDPLMPFLGPNASFDQAVRKALTPLAKFAEKMETAVVMVRHLNKSGGRHALYRGSGSIGIIAAMRSALLVAKAPHDHDLRVLCHTKNNLGPQAPSLLFEPIATSESSLPDESWTGEGTVRIEWRGVCEYKPEDLLAKVNGQADRLEAAKDFLLDLLVDGPVEQWVVKDKATEAGLAYRTVERAKEFLGVRSRRKGWGPGSKCFWKLSKENRHK